MATLPSPGTQTAASPISTGLLNGFRDAFNFFLRSGSNVAPYCFAYQATGQSIPGSLVQTALHLDSDVRDTDNMHLTTPSGSNTFFTVNTAGLYLAGAQALLGATSSGEDALTIAQNGTVMIGDNTGFINAQHRINISGPLQCAVNDVITPQVACTIANTLTGTSPGGTFMWMMLVSE